MRYLPILTLLLLANVLPAQINPTLEDLEGTWFSNDRIANTLSIWTLTDAHTLENRTYAVVCRDTLPVSHCEIRFDEQSARLSLQTDSTGRERIQTYRLVRATADELFWENTNPEGLPAHLSWIFFGNNYLTFRADGVEADYRRAQAQRVHMQLRLMAGANLSTHRRYVNSNNSNKLGYTQLGYQPKPGLEYAAAIGLRTANAPLSIYLELGYSRKCIEATSSLAFDQVQYTSSGLYRFTNTYVGFFPEIAFGPRRAITVTTGCYFDLLTRFQFEGNQAITGTGAPNPLLDKLPLSQGPERGLLAGASYELPFHWLGALHPSAYFRAMFDLGNGPRLQTYSAGLRFRVGKEQ